MREDCDIVFNIHAETGSDLSRTRFLESLEGTSTESSCTREQVLNESEEGIALSSMIDPYTVDSMAGELDVESERMEACAADSMMAEGSADPSNSEIAVTGVDTHDVHADEESSQTPVDEVIGEGKTEESEILSLSCPECSGTLVLPRQYLGIQGACVWCQTPIIALASGQDGTVELFALRAKQSSSKLPVPFPSSSVDHPLTELDSDDSDDAESVQSSVELTSASDVTASLWMQATGVSSFEQDSIPENSKQSSSASEEGVLSHASPCSLDALNTSQIVEAGDQATYSPSETEGGEPASGAEFEHVDVPALSAWGPSSFLSDSPTQDSKAPEESQRAESASWPGISTPTPWGHPSAHIGDAAPISVSTSPVNTPDVLASGFEPESNSLETRNEDEALHFSSNWGSDSFGEADPVTSESPAEDMAKSGLEFGFPSSLTTGFSTGSATRLTEQASTKASVFVNDWPPASTDSSDTLASSLWMTSDPDEGPRTLPADAPFREEILKPSPNLRETGSSSSSIFGFSGLSSADQIENSPQDSWGSEPVSQSPVASSSPVSAGSSQAPDSSLSTQTETLTAPTPLSDGSTRPSHSEGLAPISTQKKVRKSFLLITVIVLGFCVGTALSTYILPVNRYVASAKDYLITKLTPAPAVPVMPKAPETVP